MEDEYRIVDKDKVSPEEWAAVLAQQEQEQADLGAAVLAIINVTVADDMRWPATLTQHLADSDDDTWKSMVCAIAQRDPTAMNSLMFGLDEEELQRLAAGDD